MRYPSIFSPLRVGNITLKNRIVMSPMGSLTSAPDGSVNERMYHYYVQRARGGAGLIILGATSPDYHLTVSANVQTQLTDLNVLASYARLTDGIHNYGAKVFVQFQHAGDRSMNPNYRIVSADERETSACGEHVYPLTKDEIAHIVEGFASSSRNAKEVGFDGVEIHAGHGYLIGQFLSPLSNHRSDEYGGSTENRARFMCEVIRAIRQRCGRDFVISVRLAIKDNKEGGIVPEEGAVFARMAQDAGADLINCTTGITVPLNTSVETQDKPEGGRVPLAEIVKKNVTIPVAIVGKLRDPNMCEDILSSGKADLVVIGRQLICDPFWPKKIREGREDEIRKCLSCSEGCYNFVRGISCACNPYAGSEWIYQENDLPLSRSPKKVLVVGAGVAGMQAAVTAAERGHEVTVIEKSRHSGGQLLAASTPPHKDVLLSFDRYLRRRLELLGVKVHFGMRADLQTIQDFKPDKVLLATGSLSVNPPIPGIDRSYFARDVLGGEIPTPHNKKVVIIGGGTIGCEAALYLAQFSNEITIVEMTGELSRGQQPTHKRRDLYLIDKLGIRTYLKCGVSEVTDEAVICRMEDGEALRLPADLVLTACGQRPVGTDLYEELWDAGIPAEMVGSSAGTVNIRTSVAMGFTAGYEA